MEKQLDIIVGDRLPKVVAAETMIKNTLDMGRQIRNLILLETPEERHAVKEKIAALRAGNAAELEMLDKTLTSETSRGILKNINESRTWVGSFYGRIFELAESDRAAARKLVLGDFIKSNDQLIHHLNELARYEKDMMAKQRAESKQAAITARNTVTTIALVAFLMSCLVAYAIITSINSPLKKIQQVVSTVREQNDFTVDVPVSGKDELSETSLAFRELLVTLRQTLGQFSCAIARVAGASSELVDASKQSASASSIVSGSASSMAASVEQMSVSISLVSENAQSASELAEKAGQLSEQGGEIIAETVREMERIGMAIDRVASVIADLGDRSNQISSITQVIKDVADQTNLLALNAAIEAARAGETGRGFAVVADEVRKLAERTTQATTEISEMISGIQRSTHDALEATQATVSQVCTGRELAEKAGISIVEIRASTNEVVTVVSDIASAITEQSSASQSIAQQLESVAQAAEENNATTEETARSANDLGQLAIEMRALTARFRI
jgi:methyl-accepting chemotaxis protein